MIFNVLAVIFGVNMGIWAHDLFAPRLKPSLRYIQRRLFRPIEWKLQFHMAAHLALMVENTALKMGITCTVLHQTMHRSQVKFWQVDNLHWVSIRFPVDAKHYMEYAMTIHQPYSAEKLEEIICGGLAASHSNDGLMSTEQPPGVAEDADWWRGN